MLAYAANAPRFAERRRSPRTLLLIAGVHAVALAVLMSAKMDIIPRDFGGPDVIFIPDPKPQPKDPPPKPQPQTDPQPRDSFVDRTTPIVPLDPVGPTVDPFPANQPPLGPIAGAGTVVVTNPPIHRPVLVAARFNTPDWALKPPYPPAMQAREIEATLRLRLQIDDQGRVVSVEPVGRADPAFLVAARKHLIAKWRYRPATEDGRPVHSSTVITLRFELEA